ncbi:hypothetical protein ERO13_D10G099150v2 [Gossypium hirsutum]|uniref:Uncharacterized protein n=2 Tax=Gossypium TaxID=3633 RepID=A0A5D2T7E8_GOSMU|nr:hypothetical protein ERO13_D10G099150v2 [Gossypium hirsutum]TYG49691.1 hypothetical protein ES288_D10G114700v1 [Gossypium darwinii]TYI60566.1 hypothetical protein E1A91_D10G112500v1 [Gossypium mustelinum]
MAECLPRSRTPLISWTSSPSKARLALVLTPTIFPSGLSTYFSNRVAPAPKEEKVLTEILGLPNLFLNSALNQHPWSEKVSFYRCSRIQKFLFRQVVPFYQRSQRLFHFPTTIIGVSILTIGEAYYRQRFIFNSLYISIN